MRGIWLAGAIVLACVGEASACFSFVRTPDNQTVDAQTTIQNGKSCTIVFNSDGPIDGVRIDKRPSHGAVDVGSVGRLRYSAKAGYVGPDSFTYTRYGKDARNNPVFRSVRVAVTVTR